MKLYLIYEGDYFLKVPDHVTHVYAENELEALKLAFIADEKLREHLEYKTNDRHYLKYMLKSDMPIWDLFKGRRDLMDEYTTGELSNEAIAFLVEKLDGVGYRAKEIEPVRKENIA